MEFKPGMRVIHKVKRLSGTIVKPMESIFGDRKTWAVNVDGSPYSNIDWYECNLLPLEGTNRDMANYLLREKEDIL